jgi:hypothetical protein
MRVPGVTKFVPGFFLEDMPLPTWAPKGLHGDTTQKLFSKSLPEAFDWSKLYSVTPKSYICEAIKTWITSDVKPDTYIVSSDREYRRWELRQIAGFRDLEPKGDVRPELIYKDFPHVLAPLTEEEIERALCFLMQR